MTGLKRFAYYDRVFPDPEWSAMRRSPDNQATETEFMIIRIIAADRQVEIDDARNFKAFSVRVEGSFDDPALQAELLGRVAVSSDREHAWISEKALREWPSLKSESWWQEGLTNMIAAVQKFGWIDNANHSIRAHIDYVP